MGAGKKSKAFICKINVLKVEIFFTVEAPLESIFLLWLLSQENVTACIACFLYKKGNYTLTWKVFNPCMQTTLNFNEIKFKLYFWISLKISMTINIGWLLWLEPLKIILNNVLEIFIFLLNALFYPFLLFLFWKKIQIFLWHWT